MNTRYYVHYLTDLADLCDRMDPSETSYAVLHLRTVLPHLLIHGESVAPDEQNTKLAAHLKARNYESALLALVPAGTTVSASFEQPLTFSFSDPRRRIALRRYSSPNPVFSLALIACYLRFVADELAFPPSDTADRTNGARWLRLASSNEPKTL